MSYSSLGSVSAGWPNDARPGLLSTLTLWIHRARQRARDREALGLLNDWDRQDLGPDRSQIEFELAKPFWRA